MNSGKSKQSTISMANRRKSTHYSQMANLQGGPNSHTPDQSKKNSEPPKAPDINKMGCWGKIQNQEITHILITPTYKCSIACFGLLTFIFGLFGGIALQNSENLHEALIRYDEECMNTMTCNITFTPDEDLVNPMIYYRIENFFANHRNFVRSRNFKQLRGATTASDDWQLI